MKYENVSTRRNKKRKNRMTLSMAWALCLIGTPVSIGFMILITYLENKSRWKEEEEEENAR